MERVRSRGFIVHAYSDRRRDREHVVGRLEDGRSFAASFPCDTVRYYVPASASRTLQTLALGSASWAEARDSSVRTFAGEPCAELVDLSGKPISRQTADRLRGAGIPVHGEGLRGATRFLAGRGIRGGITIEGEARPGKNVSLVFANAKLSGDHDARAPLFVCSLDIETAEPAGTILAVGLSLSVFRPSAPAEQREERVLLNGAFGVTFPRDLPGEEFGSEGELLLGLTARVTEMDPDIVTGWNVIDFDFPRLAAAYARNKIPFSLGRSTEAGIFFPAEEAGGSAVVGGPSKRSASVFLQGRQVLDALRLVRTGSWGLESYTLESVAQDVLGRGKTMTETAGDKLAELDRLYREDPVSFCRYCLNDARLVNEILDRKALITHTVERCALTGAGLDKAWTSVASFERIYAEGLFARGVLEPEFDKGRRVSGAAGGTVLDPLAGFFGPVAVFDFRSLYPSVMRTFNIDPLAYEEGLRAVAGGKAAELIRAPNGAFFSREAGILPALIERYFSERLAAIARGDEASAYVYKILMNSFYGVLGSPTCRYARTELAGAITSFGKWCLLFARDFFTDRGYRVLYGDTDSVFVEVPGADLDTSSLALRLNDALAARIRDEWDRESSIQIRFEKLYLRFFIPHLRGFSDGDGDDRGRAKGYAGLLSLGEGKTGVEIKGMEAVRSDYTALARRFQRELLALVFSSPDTAAAESFILDCAERMFRGDFDDELVFRKRLRREPADYTASTPPHVKVARSLGWTDRRGTVEYVMTENGPEALSLAEGRRDYGWYLESQLLPVARSVGLAAGFDADALVAAVRSGGQLEFEY